jgi:hypothetical protein
MRQIKSAVVMGFFVYDEIAPSLPAWRKCMTTTMQSTSTVDISVVSLVNMFD